jgi:hypothetical protein
LLGAAAGFSLGYTAVRAAEALADRRAPMPVRERDPKRYGATRRALMVAGIARSVAGTGLWAFAFADPAERALRGLPTALRLPAFVALVTAIDTVREWPIDYVEGHVLERVYVRFDMSRQTKKANAFVTGVFGTERIALADTLVEEFAPDETLFVVAHELGHYVRRDPWVAIGIGTMAIAATLLGAINVTRRTTNRDVAGIGGSTRLAFYGMLIQLALGPLMSAFSRAIERRADRFALAATGDAQGGIRAFRRLRDQNLAEDEGPKWAELLFSSHPSLKSRIVALGGASD